MKGIIRHEVSVHTGLNESIIKKLAHYSFAKWIKACDRKYAVEIFTTNYDYLFEIGLESLDVPYYDGFTGSFEPFFNASSLEGFDYLPNQTKLWKIHGSLGLQEINSGFGNKIVRKGSGSEAQGLLVYPSMLKYSNSKKMPYAAYMDRLHGFLKQPDAVLFTCGYSFGDEHINERILSALSTDSTSHVYAFYYNKVGDTYTLTEDDKLAKIALGNRRISALGMRNAVIGSKYVTWKMDREPDKNDSLNVDWYFDADAPINDNVEINVEQKGDEVWTGRGNLSLPDFNKFVKFLDKMIPEGEWKGTDNG